MFVNTIYKLSLPLLLSLSYTLTQVQSPPHTAIHTHTASHNHFICSFGSGSPSYFSLGWFWWSSFCHKACRQNDGAADNQLSYTTLTTIALEEWSKENTVDCRDKHVTRRWRVVSPKNQDTVLQLTLDSNNTTFSVRLCLSNWVASRWWFHCRASQLHSDIHCPIPPSLTNMHITNTRLMDIPVRIYHWLHIISRHVASNHIKGTIRQNATHNNLSNTQTLPFLWLQRVPGTRSMWIRCCADSDGGLWVIIIANMI